MISTSESSLSDEDDLLLKSLFMGEVMAKALPLESLLV